MNSLNLTYQLHEIAQGLLYLHGENVIHGDLHGVSIVTSTALVLILLQNNVLITDDRKAVLVDFGSADLEMITQTSSAMHGALEFLSPERLGAYVGEQFDQANMRPTAASDVFAFAGLCYQVACALLFIL